MHFGVNISIANTLFISVFSILFVFLVLWIISYFINLISFFCKKLQKGAQDSKKEFSNRRSSSVSRIDDEVVAVITAAIQAENEKSDIVVTAIKENGNTIWTQNSKTENIN